MAADTPPPSDDAELPEDAAPEGGRVVQLAIEDELRGAYLTYSVSVIVSRALPDVRDGLKPSQRRILVAMNDLNLGPGSSRIKCAKISGDTSGNYHPHGEAVIYPTLVRMAQDWNMRHVLVDKQGNFGSNAGLPPAAMRYTEARLSAVGAALLQDLDQDTVDFIPTYDERNVEPVVLPSKFPNLIVNGANGIAVGMTTSIPPHNLAEICQALIKVIDDPDIGVDELMEIAPGPDFPTGGIICGSSGIRRAYHTGQGTIVVRARAHIEDMPKKRKRIIVTEIPFQQTRDPLIEKIAALVNEERIKGVSAIRDESDYKDPVRIVIELKQGEDIDAEVVLNQLYEFSPLQDTFSIILRALVDGKPRMLSFKDVLVEFLRHRLIVIRRRTQFQLLKARKKKHEVEGLLLAFANIDEIIRIIRTSTTQAEAKTRLQGVPAPAAMMERALGAGFAVFQSERGVASEYFLTPVQADAILAMRLGSLVNLEQDKLGENYRALLLEIGECLRILSDDANVFAIIREDLLEMERRHRSARRTEISTEEVGDLNLEDLISEETMVVTLSTRGYIKRTPARTYQAQRRGGKGLKGASVEDDDPIEHLFVASTHAYLLFFTTNGRVYWKKVYDLPQLSREKKGRSIQQFVGFAENEKIAACLAVREFDGAERFLMMATRKGLVKKTPLSAYSRPQKGGIIAVKLREGDELVGAVVVNGYDELVLSTSDGMAIRFSTADARSMGRNSSGVKGIKLKAKDEVVALAVANPEATLLTVCEKGYGKRTPFGYSTLDPALLAAVAEGEGDDDSTAADVEPETADVDAGDAEEAGDDAEGDNSSSGKRYRTQRRGGMGIRDIKTTARNGKVVAAVPVQEDGQVLMISAKGKIQRISVHEISVVGRNTQGVRIMNIDADDKLAAVVPVPREEDVEAAEAEVDGAAAPKPLPSPDDAASTNGSGGSDE